MEDHRSRARGLMACVGDPSRFKVVIELQGHELCVTELASRVSLSQSCTTRHLQALARAGVVERRRDGKRVVFSVARGDQIDSLISWALGGREPASHESKVRRPKARPVVESITAGRPDADHQPGTRAWTPDEVGLQVERNPRMEADHERPQMRSKGPKKQGELEDYLL